MPALFDSGFTVREPAWHRQGLVLDHAPANWDEARVLAGLDWEPMESALWASRTIPMGEPVPAGAHLISFSPTGMDYVVPVPGHKAILRSDTGAVLAPTGEGYHTITNAAMGELMDTFVAQWAQQGAAVAYDTAGCLDGGRKVYATVRLDEPYQVPGDESLTYPYAVVLNSHDGSGACKVLFLQFRVVCANTWNAADVAGDRHGMQLVIRHSASAKARLETAGQVLAGMRDQAAEYREAASVLAGVAITDDVVRQFLDAFMPANPEGASQRTLDDRSTRRAQFMSLLDGPTIGAHKRTAYGLVQAAGEYLDHMRPYRSLDTYLARTLIDQENVKPKAVRLVRSLVGV